MDMARVLVFRHSVVSHLNYDNGPVTVAAFILSIQGGDMLRKSAFGLIVAATLAAGSAAAKTVDELIAQNVEARGGMDKLKAIQTLRISGKMTMGPGIEAPMTLEMKRPKRMRMEFTFQGMTGIQAYDGENGWQLMPFGGRKDPEPMSPEDLKDAEEQADMDGPLVDYKEKGHTVELLGQESVEGADVYKLKVSLKNGDIRYIYLDAEYFLAIKGEGKRMIRGSEVETEVSFGDFKEVEGVMFPHTIESGAKGGPERQKLVIETIEVNVLIDDARFKVPEAASGNEPAPKN